MNLDQTWIRWFCLGLLVASCGLEAEEKPPAWVRYPEMTIPRLSKAPVIDGTIHAEEWQAAAEVSEFILYDGPVEQTPVSYPLNVWIGWTAEGVCVAFHEVRPVDAVRPEVVTSGKGEHTGDRTPINGDFFELRLSPGCRKLGPKPPFETLVEFMGNYLGDYTSAYNLGDSFNWKGKWQYRARLTPDGWEGEALVPFSVMPNQKEPPKPGERWGIGFLRGRRTPAPGVALWDPRFGGDQAWGYPQAWAQFQETGPVVRVHKAGLLTPGRIGVDLELANPGAKTCKATVRLTLLKARGERRQPFYTAIDNLMAGEGKIVIGDLSFGIAEALKEYEAQPAEERTVTLTPSSLQQVGISREAPYGAYVLLMHVTEAATGTTLYARSMPFRYEKPSQIHATMLPYYLAADIVQTTLENEGKRLAGHFLRYRVEREGKSLREEEIPIPVRPQCRFNVSTKGVDFGQSYELVLALHGPDQKLIEERRFPMRKPPKPVWWGHEIGVSDKVPPPWTAVEAKDNTCRVWGREYRFAKGWLPSEIVSQGAQMLAEPAQLIWKDAKGEQNLSAGNLKLESQTPRAVTYSCASDNPRCQVSARATVEFDGFCWFSVDIQPKGPRDVAEIALVIPLKKEHAPFFSEADLMGFKSSRQAPIGRNGALPPEGIRNSWMYRMYAGDYERGLWWCTESSRHWNTETATDTVQIVPDGKRTLMKITFRKNDTGLTEKLHYEFGLEATPFKSIPDWQRRAKKTFEFSMGQHFSNLERYVNPEVSPLKIQDTADPADRFEWYLFFSLWNFKDFGQIYPADDQIEQGFRKAADYIRAHHGKVGAYAAWGIIKESKWVNAAYCPEMCRIPMVGHWSNQYRECDSSAFASYHLYGVKHMMDRCGLQGVYYDGSLEVGACQGLGHGCGWVDAEGKVHATYPVRGTRKMAMRVYQLLNEKYGYGNAYVHVHDCFASFGPVHAFATSRITGEGKNSIPTLYLAYSPDKIAATDNPVASGLPVDYSTEYMNPEVSFESILSVGVPFGILGSPNVCNWFYPGGDLRPKVPAKHPGFKYYPRQAMVTEIMSRFPWEGAEWWPFYKNGDRLKIEPLVCQTTFPETPWKPEILGSFYFNPKEKTGVLFVSNLYTPYVRECRVSLDLAKLGLPPNVRIVLPLEGGRRMRHANGTFDLRLTGNEFEMFVFGESDWGGKLKPWLGEAPLPPEGK